VRSISHLEPKRGMMDSSSRRSSHLKGRRSDRLTALAQEKQQLVEDSLDLNSESINRSQLTFKSDLDIKYKSSPFQDRHSPFNSHRPGTPRRPKSQLSLREVLEEIHDAEDLNGSRNNLLKAEDSSRVEQPSVRLEFQASAVPIQKSGELHYVRTVTDP